MFGFTKTAGQWACWWIGVNSSGVWLTVDRLWNNEGSVESWGK